MNYCVVGMAYGDEGKGSIVDSLVRKLNSKHVILFCGGPQASHHVVLPDGTSHGFSQWGSGTFAGAATYISRYRMIEPFALDAEAEALFTKGVASPFSLLRVDKNCTIITPWQWRVNRIREMARQLNCTAHGSCGMGIGETRQDMLDGYRLTAGNYTEFGLNQIRNRKLHEAAQFGQAQYDYVADAEYSVQNVLRKYDEIFSKINCGDLDLQGLTNAVYEGSQGFLLDETYGFAPHNTWSDVTPYYARVLSGGGDNLHVIGVLPAEPTRHGAGPFPSEQLSSADGSSNHNRANLWQGNLRYGLFDTVMARYAISNIRPDSIALTQVDKVKWPLRMVSLYTTENGDVLRRLPNGTSTAALSIMRAVPDPFGCRTHQSLQSELGVPFSIISRGPTYRDKEFSYVCALT